MNAITESLHLEDDGDHHAPVTRQGYLNGFFMAVILTAIPFWMVMDGHAPHSAIIGVVLGLAMVQIVVHFVYFLHMNTSSGQRWNLIALVFTALILAIMIGGSVWIMYHLNHNMIYVPANQE